MNPDVDSNRVVSHETHNVLSTWTSLVPLEIFHCHQTPRTHFCPLQVDASSSAPFLASLTALTVPLPGDAVVLWDAVLHDPAGAYDPLTGQRLYLESQHSFFGRRVSTGKIVS